MSETKSQWKFVCHPIEYEGQERTDLNVFFVEHFAFAPVSLLSKGSSPAPRTLTPNLHRTRPQKSWSFMHFSVVHTSLWCQSLPPSSCLCITDVCLHSYPCLHYDSSCWIPTQPWFLSPTHPSSSYASDLIFCSMEERHHCSFGEPPLYGLLFLSFPAVWPHPFSLVGFSFPVWLLGALPFIQHASHLFSG